jgi:cysteine synthase B
MLNQFVSRATPGMHYKTTGWKYGEILEGTNNSFCFHLWNHRNHYYGRIEYLKEKIPPFKIVGCQPTDGSQIPVSVKWPGSAYAKIFDRKELTALLKWDEKMP